MAISQKICIRLNSTDVISKGETNFLHPQKSVFKICEWPHFKSWKNFSWGGGSVPNVDVLIRDLSNADIGWRLLCMTPLMKMVITTTYGFHFWRWGNFIPRICQFARKPRSHQNKTHQITSGQELFFCFFFLFSFSCHEIKRKHSFWRNYK